MPKCGKNHKCKLIFKDVNTFMDDRAISSRLPFLHAPWHLWANTRPGLGNSLVSAVLPMSHVSSVLWKLPRHGLLLQPDSTVLGFIRTFPTGIQLMNPRVSRLEWNFKVIWSSASPVTLHIVFRVWHPPPPSLVAGAHYLLRENYAIAE